MIDKEGTSGAEPADQLTPAPGDRQMFENICGDFGIRIGRDGTWYYHGSPIGRKPLVKLFSTVLRKDDDGRYWLITPVEKGLIEVDDVPFVAVEMTAEGAGADQRVTLRTNLDDCVVLGADHPLRVEEDPETGEPSPYVLVRNNWRQDWRGRFSITLWTLAKNGRSTARRSSACRARATSFASEALKIRAIVAFHEA